MNHAAILTAYLSRLKLKDLRDILHSAEACSHAQLNYGTSAQLEEQRQFDQTVAEAVGSLFKHDVELIDAAVRRESLADDPSSDVIRSANDPVAFTTKGILEIVQDLPGPRYLRARTEPDRRWNVPLYLEAPQAVSREEAEGFLAEYHAVVWASAEESDVAYDDAGKDIVEEFLSRFGRGSHG